jgi:hypothetical protein
LIWSVPTKALQTMAEVKWQIDFCLLFGWL